MAMERDGWGLAAMAATAMGHVGNGASARWCATAIERDGWGIGGLMGARGLFEADSKWLEGLILGAAGRLDGAETRAQERRWGQQQ
jgi:hypothetical protein